MEALIKVNSRLSKFLRFPLALISQLVFVASAGCSGVNLNLFHGWGLTMEGPEAASEAQRRERQEEGSRDGAPGPGAKPRNMPPISALRAS